MIIFCDNQTTKEDIQKYLIGIADYFLPPLYMCVDIDAYAEKIRRLAYTGEAWFENRLIGLIACYLNNNDTYEAFITHLSVNAQFRNMGIASNLIKMVFDKAHEISFEKIVLEVESNNKKAISLYQRNFFEITGANGTKFVMTKILPPPPPPNISNIYSILLLLYTCEDIELCILA